MYDLMNQHTVSVGTADWIRASRNLKISAYVEVSPETISEGMDVFTKADFEKALRKVNRRIRPLQSGPSSLGT